MFHDYSELFSCLFDQKSSGIEGKSAHHSVFQAVTWQDKMMRPLKTAKMQSFAVVWDEDHDARVLDVAEELYVKGLFSPILFIGERRGNLVVILDDEFIKKSTKAELETYKSAVFQIGQHPYHKDAWHVDFGFFERISVDGARYINSAGITYAGNGDDFINEIYQEWGLGIKEFTPSPRVAPGHE